MHLVLQYVCLLCTAAPHISLVGTSTWGLRICPARPAPLLPHLHSLRVSKSCLSCSCHGRECQLGFKIWLQCLL